MKPKLSVYQIIVVLFALPFLYLSFVFYQTGNIAIGSAVLVVTALGLYVYLKDSAVTYRYLFPGFLGFGVFVLFPLLYTVYIGFTKYSSQNLLRYDRSLSLIRNETFVAANAAAYKYRLYAQEDHSYVLYLEDEKAPDHRFLSEPFDLNPVEKGSSQSDNIKLTPFNGGEIKGRAMEIAQITRGKLLPPLRKKQFALPDETLVGMAGLTNFAMRERVWNQNPNGTLTNKKDGTIIHADHHQGFFTDQKGERYGIGFRTFNALENYTRIVADPRIQGPFLRIFIWTFAFSMLSMLLTFAAGMLLAVILEQKDLRFRRTYRTLFILPYAVPAVLSILILKGLFNQEFGAINELLRSLIGFAPDWETNPWGARAMILLVNLWLGYPYMMLICTGMLQSIPSGIYEASSIDGSNAVIDFFKLTLPLVLPPMIPILISTFAFNFNNFNLIYLLTAGGPQMVGGNAGETDLLVNYTYNLAFRDAGTNYGLAGAIATLLFILVGILAWINLRFTGRRAKI